jgi:S1-C subfamily serine protease
MPKLNLFLIAALLLVPKFAAGQPQPTFSVTRRVYMIRVGTNYGSSFTIERGGKQYLITARHLVTNLPLRNAKVEVRRSNGVWEEIIGDLILPSNRYVDIAVLSLTRDLSDRDTDYELLGTVSLGQPCYFLGFPYFIGTIAFGEIAPFEKHAYLSAIDSDPDEPTFFLDGFNNPGFSGGPVVFYNPKSSKWMIVAVVSGYRNTSAQRRENGKLIDTDILTNSGIVISYPLKPAIDAIDKAEH